MVFYLTVFRALSTQILAIFCALETALRLIFVAIRSRNVRPDWWPLAAAILNHICARSKSCSEAIPRAYKMPRLTCDCKFPIAAACLYRLRAFCDLG